ncbi:SET domain-containing protein 4 isoform X1 [Bacillus rossius redtenbacheri]|uniref:SET domain-containing protein 4 isoform X1 n=1 Tax=Bacillus rossius redtenbacheri TaxID=93214 RepID=UPI002FDDBADB
MGRLQRKRKRKWKKGVVEDGDSVCSKLVQWMGEKDCALPDNIRWAYFNDTGRGLFSTTYLQKDSLLIRLPKRLLITVHTVLQSCIGNWFCRADHSQAFSNQQVLAAFITWERHLGHESRWDAYIRSLPREYTTPLMLSGREKAALPTYLRDGVHVQERMVVEAYKQLVSTIGKRSLCEHCGKSLLADVFSFPSFQWAWNTVNTRAVYVKPTTSAVKLRDENTLALAPFLDLFNHSCLTNTTVEETAEAYCLFSSGEWQPNSQVFISYGPHSNCKLYLEYGFVVRSNPHDVVPVTAEEVDQVVNSICEVTSKTFCKARNELIQQNRLTENLCFSNEGPSFTLQAYIFLRAACGFDKNLFQQKIFAYEFTEVERDIINKIILGLLCDKIEDYQQQVSSMSQLSPCSESFGLARTLVKYHLELLECIHKKLFMVK